MRHYLCSHLPVKGSKAQRTMAVALAQALDTKGVIHSVDGRRSVYRQTYKGWNETGSGSLVLNSY